MLFGIATFLVNLFGLEFEKARKIAAFLFVAIVLVVVIVPTVFIFRACNKPPKLDIKNVEKINKANATERRKELQVTIEQNADVVRTVDGRNAISETNEAERQAAIWSKINDADDKIKAAKSQGRDVTGPELECMLTGVCE